MLESKNTGKENELETEVDTNVNEEILNGLAEKDSKKIGADEKMPEEPTETAEENEADEAENSEETDETEDKKTPEETEELSETEEEPKKKKKGKKSNPFKTEKFRRGSMGFAFTIVFIALLVVVNVIFSVLEDKYPSMKIDLTSQKLNSLSESTKSVAENLTSDIEIYIIGEEDAIRNDQLYSSYNVKYSQLANLCDRLAENDKITVKYVDPDADPSFISQYSDDNLSSGMVLIKSDKRYRVLSVSDLFEINYDESYNAVNYTKVDGALANAMYLVDMDTVPVIAVDTGYGELLSDDYRTSLDDLLEGNCFEIKEFNLLTDDIPEDATMVMLLTPTTDLTDEDVEKLSNYLSTGDISHTLFVTGYPTAGELPNLSSLLEEWGLKMESGTVLVETDTSKTISSSATYMFVNATDDILTGTYSNLLAINAMPVDILFEENGDIKTYPLIETSSTVYTSTGETQSDPDTDTYTVAALAQKTDGDVKRNVVAYGDTNSLYAYMSNSTFGNADFILDLVQYCTDTSDTSVGLTVESTQTTTRDITASTATCVIVGLFVFTIAIPLVIVVLGIVVFVRRRHL